MNPFFNSHLLGHAKGIFFVAIVVLISACSTKTTVSRRIDQNGTLFHQKSYSDKIAITHGNIAPGMSRDAVYLAWGNPNRRTEGVSDGVPYEEWIYKKISPKLNIDLAIGKGPGLGLKKDTTKTVKFVDGKVSDYQKNF